MQETKYESANQHIHKSVSHVKYKVGNTAYTVSSIFSETGGKELIEDKIMRLILQDKKMNNCSNIYSIDKLDKGGEA